MSPPRHSSANRKRVGAEQGNERAWMQTQNISGAVAAVGRNDLTVHSDAGKDMRLQVSDSTAVNLDGRAASMSEIRPGSDVRASYGVVDGKTTAVQLDVASR